MVVAGATAVAQAAAEAAAEEAEPAEESDEGEGTNDERPPFADGEVAAACPELLQALEGEEGVRCTTPAVAQAGSVAVHLINNDAVYVTSVAFLYQPAVSVRSLQPVVGMLSGSTVLTVRGSGFVPSMTTRVRFGSRQVLSARVLGADMLEVTTPAHTQPELLPVEVTLNEQDFSSDEVLFEVQALAHVAEVAPAKQKLPAGHA